ncbi:hypothetical protein Q7P37_005679 [Cladosporium fusiforme]
MAPVTRSKALQKKSPAATSSAATSSAASKAKKSRAARKTKTPAPKTKPAKVAKKQKTANKNSKTKPAKSKVKKKPSPLPEASPAHAEEEEEDWELSESYRILPYLNSPGLMGSAPAPRAPSSKSKKSNLSKKGEQASAAAAAAASAPPPRPFRHDLSDLVRDYPALRKTPTPLATPTPSSTRRRAVHFSDDEEDIIPAHLIKREPQSSSAPRAAALADLPHYAPSSHFLEPTGYDPNARPQSIQDSATIRNGWAEPLNQAAGIATAPRRGRSHEGRGAEREVRTSLEPQITPRQNAQPSKKSQRTSDVVRDIRNHVQAQVQRRAEEHAPRGAESPVSVNNAQVFRRPTVATLRSERALFRDELGRLVAKLEGVKGVVEGVIEEATDRMRVLDAVNRMQAPLRRAPLGRDRRRVRSG